MFSPTASAQKPEEVIQRYMEAVSAVPDEVCHVPCRFALIGGGREKGRGYVTSPVKHSGLHHLHGPAVQHVRLRGGPVRGEQSEHRAQQRGEVRAMRPHPPHALHAGYVQQRDKGTRAAAMFTRDAPQTEGEGLFRVRRAVWEKFCFNSEDPLCRVIGSALQSRYPDG